MFHPIAPEVDINFYGSQAKENVGLDSDIGLLILVDKAINQKSLFLLLKIFKGMK